ncbi:M48 family metalloprotease [Sphingomonas sp. H160509]|uniref:M48 family metallopeptidase n=1 Tax=Sphingomonas sp. H160509 TaxID=2955313 RepID=UPI002096BD0A|nr:M48 family metalloprotease [Sphingomonas sp. H160509]MDD1451481.1 M48 family metalloprotease [Sphingomonas sp. H160509]
MKRLVAAAATALLLWTTPLQAQSILRDAETETMFAEMSNPLIKAAGLSTRDVKVVLINDESINAFVAGGQTVYVHSGLIQAADNANEVQGVIAHELGHIADGHVVLADRGTKPAMGMYLLSMVLGLAAMAAGSGEAGAGIMAAGQQAAMGTYLSFSRVQESTADATGAKFLREANISGRGMLSFFKKLQQQEYRFGTANIDPFMQSHPLSGERVATLTADLQASPAWANKPDAALEERFRRVKAKLAGYVMPADQTLQAFPPSNQSIYAHYARAYAYHKSGYPEKADAEANALVKAEPTDPYFLEIKGQILLEAGKPVDSLVPPARSHGGLAQQPADRHHLRPRADRDREQGELPRGDQGPAHRGRPRRPEPVRLDAARHSLRADRRYRARRARHRRAREHGRRHADRVGERAICAGEHPGEHHRLDPRAGYRDGRAERDGRQPQAV